MTIKNQNFEMYAGDTKNVSVTITNSSGAVVNLTGAVITWVLTFQSGTLQKATATGTITVANPATGVFTFNLLPIDTTGKQGVFNHGVEMVDATGNASTLLTGLATIVPTIF